MNKAFYKDIMSTLCLSSSPSIINNFLKMLMNTIKNINQ